MGQRSPVSLKRYIRDSKHIPVLFGVVLVLAACTNGQATSTNDSIKVEPQATGQITPPPPVGEDTFGPEAPDVEGVVPGSVPNNQPPSGPTTVTATPPSQSSSEEATTPPTKPNNSTKPGKGKPAPAKAGGKPGGDKAGSGKTNNDKSANGKPKADAGKGSKPSKYFPTSKPGSSLPSGDECAKRVRPTPENVPENKPFNQTKGRTVVGETYLSKSIKAADYEARVDGNFTGTTDEIIQWGACKWGFDEDIIRAVAYTESTWYAGKLGNCKETAQPEAGGQGGCASTGLLQVRGANVKPVHPGTWPEGWKSTAFNVDYTLAIRRACYEGRELWLNDEPDTVGRYGAGDEWRCVGRWASGNWNPGSSKAYVDEVRSHVANKSWNGFVGCPDWQETFHCTNPENEPSNR